VVKIQQFDDFANNTSILFLIFILGSPSHVAIQDFDAPVEEIEESDSEEYEEIR
jgi:hypothetical protein